MPPRNLNFLTYLRGARSRVNDRQRLLPRDGPSETQKFYRAIGRLKERGLAPPKRFQEWMRSWWSGYQSLPDRDDEKTDAEYEEDGRVAVRQAFSAALKKIPGGKLANAADTESQAVLLWSAAQEISGSSGPSGELKEALEAIALLKEGRAAGQALAVPVSFIPAFGQLPFLEKATEALSSYAVRWVTRRLSETIATLDRSVLARTLHTHALDELEDQEHDENPPPDPVITDYKDRRHALYAMVVLRVGFDLLKHDLEQRNEGRDDFTAIEFLVSALR